MKTIYIAALKTLPKEDIDHTSYQSDLYLRNTEMARKLCEEFNIKPTPFIDAIEHKPWLEIQGAFPVEIYKEEVIDEHGKSRLKDHYHFCQYDYEKQMFIYDNGICVKKYKKEISIPLEELETNWKWIYRAW